MDEYSFIHQIAFSANEWTNLVFVAINTFKYLLPYPVNLLFVLHMLRYLVSVSSQNDFISLMFD